jgi:hypothetical protein
MWPAGLLEEGDDSMTVVQRFGAALVALMALPALAYKHSLQFWKALTAWTPPGLIPGEAGVVVVTYCNRLSAIGISAPTGSAAAQLRTQTVQVFFADTDAQAVITHNWGLPNSYPAWLLPQVFANKALGGGSDSSFASQFTFGLTNTNSVTMNKLSVGVGSGGTYNVYLIRGD